MTFCLYGPIFPYEEGNQINLKILFYIARQNVRQVA